MCFDFLTHRSHRCNKSCNNLPFYRKKVVKRGIMWQLSFHIIRSLFTYKHVLFLQKCTHFQSFRFFFFFSHLIHFVRLVTGAILRQALATFSLIFHRMGAIFKDRHPIPTGNMRNPRGETLIYLECPTRKCTRFFRDVFMVIYGPKIFKNGTFPSKSRRLAGYVYKVKIKKKIHSYEIKIRRYMRNHHLSILLSVIYFLK